MVSQASISPTASLPSRAGVGEGVDRQHHGDQHEAQRQRQRQVALAGFQRDGGGHHARHAVDVAADDHHRADFGDGAAEARQPRRAQRKAAVPEQRCRGARAAGAERTQLFAVLGPFVGHHLARQRGDDGRDQDGLGADHRRRRKQQPEAAERTGARQQQVDQQADHHRRQAHQAVEQHHQQPASGKAADRQQRADRHADDAGDQSRTEADAQAEPDDAGQFGVGTRHQLPGREEGIPQCRHCLCNRRA
jgi:hypothetical protein